MYSKISKGKKKWNSGKKYEEILGRERSDEYKEKISQSLSGRSWQASSPEIEQERRRKLSEIIKRRYEAGWDPKAGRCKKIKYSSKIAGDIVVDGSWELAVAQFFDKIGINWRRNKNRFQYRYDNKDRMYTPDFYLPDDGVYIEVKGYKTEKDQAKWLQFPHELKVVMKDEVKMIKDGVFTKVNLDRLDSHWCGTPDC
tara:strand:- start:1954 stop:2547 length:594 start_codon:yes stop_codon:yes gene_type:complete